MALPKKIRRTIHIDGEDCEYAVTKGWDKDSKNIYIKGTSGKEVRLKLGGSCRQGITPKDIRDIYLDKDQWLKSVENLQV